MIRGKINGLYLALLFLASCNPSKDSDNKEFKPRPDGKPVEAPSNGYSPNPAESHTQDIGDCQEKDVLCVKNIFLTARNESKILPLTDRITLSISSISSNDELASVLASFGQGELDPYYKSNRLLNRKTDETIAILNKPSASPEDADSVCGNAKSSLAEIGEIGKSFSKILDQLRGVYDLIEKGNLLAEKLFRCKEMPVTK